MNQKQVVVKDERHVRIEMLKGDRVIFSDVVVSEEAGRHCARFYAASYEEVDPGPDLARYQLGSIVVRAFFTNDSVSDLANEAWRQERAQLQRYERMTADLEGVAKDLESLRGETGLGYRYLLPVPEASRPRIEPGRWIVFREGNDRTPVATLSDETARIESVSASGKMIDVSHPEGFKSGTLVKIRVQDVAGSFPTRVAALRAIEHSVVTRSMMAVLWNARVVSMKALLDDETRFTAKH